MVQQLSLEKRRYLYSQTEHHVKPNNCPQSMSSGIVTHGPISGKILTKKQDTAYIDRRREVLQK